MQKLSGKFSRKIKDFNPERILVVEDDKANALVISTLLELLGFPYDMVESGEEAVRVAGRRKHSLILMDMMLTEMDGIQATRQIRAHERKKKLSPVPIMAVTAKSCIEAKSACLQAGMNDYLTKPIRLEELKEKIADIRLANDRHVKVA
jgi:CheY-like chemotaxis protein